MNIGSLNLAREILVMAEIGNNHEGSYSMAEELIGRAAECGVGAVKFQTFRTEHYVSGRETDRFSRLKSYELSYDEFERLSKLAVSMGLLFISPPFDIESALFLNTVAPAIKISSGDNNFYPLLEVVAQLGKPVILSSGMTDLREISQSKDFIEQQWRERGIVQHVAVLHCVSSYPVPPAEANLAAIPSLRDRLQCTVGYSDHTLGVEAAVLAVALGARIVEKHFTLDKNQSDFRDHQLSADPREMTHLVERIKEAVLLLGTGEKKAQTSELASITVARRSVAACRDLTPGTVVTREDITWVRPAEGIPPGQEHLVVGKTLASGVHRGEPITADHLVEDAQP